MENVNWLKLKLNQKKIDLQSAKANINANLSSVGGNAKNLVQQTQNKIINQYQQQFINPQQLRMNNLASIDRAVYIKNLLNLPKNMVEFLVMVQNDGKMPNLQKPENQGNLNKPNLPNTPNQPNLPQNPNQNINPNKPNTPNLPQQPAQNLNPNKPNVPQNPALPNKPNIPNNQNRPNMPNVMPNKPDAPNVPNRPLQPNTPNLPQNPNQNINPNRPNTPHQPIKPDVLDKPLNNIKDNLNGIKDNIANNLNNIKENVQNKTENFIQSTKQNIKNQSLLNPHNQLHNAVRNSVRNGIIINQQTAQDMEMAEQLQVNNQQTQGMTAEELAKFKQNLASQLNANVNLTNVSALLQKNSKLAMNKMVSMMTMATAQGMTDVKPLQDTINIINASVSANSQSDATQTLKNLMLLYLPWLPLQEGVGFDLEIEQDSDIPESDTYIKILITTVNYGNLSATVSLVSGNSVDVSVVCSEKFPKKELFKRLQKDGSQHSMQTVIDFKEQKPQEQQDTINPKAKVNLSNVNQVNPYLLLMSHAIIRHTIELDATMTIGKQPIDD